MNEYLPGVGLSPHVDTHSAFEGAVASLSLAGGCVMEFRRAGAPAAALALPRRSLLVMGGEARHAWCGDGVVMGGGAEGGGSRGAGRADWRRA